MLALPAGIRPREAKGSVNWLAESRHWGSYMNVQGKPRRRSPLSLLLTIALSASAVGLVASPAHAAYECGKSLTAPADDAPNTANGGDEANVDNLDVVAGGVNATDADSFTVAIGVKDLSKDFPPNATSINWYFEWTYADVHYFGRAGIQISDPETVAYSYGVYDPTTSRYTGTAATEGVFTEGEGGTVAIDVPFEGVGAPPPGDVLTEVFAQTFIGQGVPGAVSSLSSIDRGPKAEGEFGADYTIGSCAGGSDPGADPGEGSLASPKAGLGFNDKTPKRGETITAKASLKVCGDHAGTNIELQKKVGGKFKKVASKKLSSSCKASFKVVASFKSATFRSFWRQQDDDHRSGQSKPVTVTTH